MERFLSMLVRGSRGPKVKSLQRKLNLLGFKCGNPDGIFGSKTKVAVMEFQEHYLVDGIVDSVTEKAIAEASQAWIIKGEGKNILLEVPRGLDEIEATFGKFSYGEKDNGYIQIDPGWTKENIVDVDLPIVGSTKCHKLMVPVFTAVFQELKDKGLDKLITEFGGIWSARHKMHNPKRSLSSHSWAISCDINPSTNMPGDVGDMDDKIVHTFERYGFQWGGRWKYRDDMHFQLCTGY